MTCKKCGRTAADGGGHWIGCEGAKHPLPRAQAAPEPEPAPTGLCEVEGCEQPKASNHPRAKFCADHKAGK